MFMRLKVYKTTKNLNSGADGKFNDIKYPI